MLNIWFRGGENPDGTPIEVIDAIDFYFKYLFDGRSFCKRNDKRC